MRKSEFKKLKVGDIIKITDRTWGSYGEEKEIIEIEDGWLRCDPHHSINEYKAITKVGEPSRDEYWTILEECAKTAKDRQEVYAPITENYTNLVNTYESFTNKKSSILEFNEHMIALKLGRIKSSPDHEDNYIDLINYLAMQVQFMRNQK